MRLNLSILFFLFLLTSCSKNHLFKRDVVKISKELKYIKLTDQLGRNYRTGIDRRYKIITIEAIIDSFVIFDPEKYKNIKLDKISAVDKQLYKLTVDSRKSYVEESKIADNAMTVFDSINRKKLFDIIKKYGFPSYTLRDWRGDENRVGILVVLTHTDPNSNFGKQFLSLMLSEFKEGRVEEDAMRHYLWHVDGRIGEINRTTPLLEWIKKVENNRKKS